MAMEVLLQEFVYGLNYKDCPGPFVATANSHTPVYMWQCYGW